MTTPQPIQSFSRPAPIIPPQEAIPLAYVIVKKSQRCLCCSSIHEFSELYLKSHLGPRLGYGKKVLNLHRLVESPKWNLPIEKLQQNLESLPFCHSCNSPSLLDLPSPPSPEKPSIRLASQAPQPPLKANEVSRLNRSPRDQKTLDELFSDL